LWARMIQHYAVSKYKLQSDFVRSNSEGMCKFVWEIGSLSQLRLNYNYVDDRPKGF
jgi:hypothetical protein